MRMPFLNSVPGAEEYQTAFGGYNHTENCSELEFFDMKNMSSDLFPILSPRKKRGKLNLAGTKVRGIISKDKMCHVADRSFYIDNVEVEGFEIEGDEPVNLTEMGAYVLIFPQKLYVNTIDPSQHGVIEKKASVPTEGSVFLANSSGSILALPPYPKTQEEGEAKGFYVTETDGVTVLNVKTDDGWRQEEPCFGLNNHWSVTYPEGYPGGKELERFTKGAYVDVSGLAEIGLDGEKRIENTVKDLGTNGATTLIFRGFLPEDFLSVLTSSTVTITQQVPNMDFVVESGNRLWGCRYGEDLRGNFVNQIYASALGDFAVWNDFSGESSDSYTVSVGSDGKWTGAIRYQDHPIFFKEHLFHRVYGNLPENYQVQVYENAGLQSGSHKSLAIVENVLFYKGIDGFYAFDGTVPQLISSALGKEKFFEAVCGECDRKYYASVKDQTGRSHFFAYDVSQNMWHKEDDLQLTDTTSKGTELYCLSEGEVLTISSAETEVERDMGWYAETGIIGKSTPDKKVIQKLKIRAELDAASLVQVMIEYDSSGRFEPVYMMEGRILQSYTVPIRIHRCDHFKILFLGRGPAKIHSLSKVTLKRSEKG